MAKPTRTAVDLYGDLVVKQPELAGRMVVINLRNPINFDEVVSRAKSAELILPALFGSLRDEACIRTRNRSAFLRMCKVFGARISFLSRPARSLLQHIMQFRIAETRVTARAHATRTVGVERRCQVLEEWLDLLCAYVRGKDSHAAVDVITDAAR